MPADGKVPPYLEHDHAAQQSVAGGEPADDELEHVHVNNGGGEDGLYHQHRNRHQLRIRSLRAVGEPLYQVTNGTSACGIAERTTAKEFDRLLIH